MILHPCPECSGEIKIYARTGVGAVAVCQKCKAEYTVCGIADLHIYNGCKIRKSTIEKVMRLWNKKHPHRNPGILASINPEWADAIFDRIKHYEVRKTKPSISVPFKVFIYCTKNGKVFFRNSNGSTFTTPYSAKKLLSEMPNAKILNGKVIGEFICDEIIEISREHIVNTPNAPDRIRSALYDSCVSQEALIRYCGEKDVLYFWHISKLKKYDEPKEISDFCGPDYKQEVFGSWVWKMGSVLTRAPQSYCFANALQEVE